jgi:hypothetical protein
MEGKNMVIDRGADEAVSHRVDLEERNPKKTWGRQSVAWAGNSNRKVLVVLSGGNPLNCVF